MINMKNPVNFIVVLLTVLAIVTPSFAKAEYTAYDYLEDIPSAYIYTQWFGMFLDNGGGFAWPVVLSAPNIVPGLYFEGSYNQSVIGINEVAGSTYSIAGGLRLFENRGQGTHFYTESSNMRYEYDKIIHTYSGYYYQAPQISSTILMLEALNWQYFGAVSPSQQLQGNLGPQKSNTIFIPKIRFQHTYDYVYRNGRCRNFEYLDLGLMVSSDGMQMGPWIKWATFNSGFPFTFAAGWVQPFKENKDSLYLVIELTMSLFFSLDNRFDTGFILF